MLAPLAFLLAADLADVSEALRRFVEVFAVVERESAEPVAPAGALYGGAIPGLLRGLDPHSIFLDPDQFQQLREMSNSEQKGFGSIVSILPGRVFVLQTLPETPSARAGLSPGDEIVGVNNVPLMGLEPEQLVQLLSQSRRQPAKVFVRRASAPRLLEFLLTPETVAASSVDRAFLLEPGVGYVRVANFDTKTGLELRRRVEELGGMDLRGLVLDLRNNPGGVVEAALESVSLFLDPGLTILKIRGRNKKEEEIRVPEGATPWKFPVSVLINEKTASAAEIVAASLQDHRRAKVVGQRSFGKGLVQTVYPLREGTGVALTVAFYYSPLGRNIQRPLEDVQLATSQKKSGDAGGVIPDAIVSGEAYTRLRLVLDQSGLLTGFATDFVRRGAPSRGFRVEGPLLDEFRAWLSARRVQPGVAEWSADLNWIRSRLEQEIINLAFGVEKGDEVEAARDPQVQRAVDFVRQPLRASTMTGSTERPMIPKSTLSK